MTDKEANKIAEAAYESDGPIEEFEQAHWKAEREEKARKVLKMKKYSDPMDFTEIIIWGCRIATVVVAVLLIGLGVLLSKALS